LASVSGQNTVRWGTMWGKWEGVHFVRENTEDRSRRRPFDPSGLLPHPSRSPSNSIA